MKKCVSLFVILLLAINAISNNVQMPGTVKVLSVTGGVATLEITLSWDNSWRDDYNWDAAWLFFKFKAGVNSPWQHALIDTANATVIGGKYSAMPATNAAAKVPGLFIYPSENRGGNTGNLTIQVKWATTYSEAQFKNNDVFIVAHAIEMVYIPYGAYALGDGTSASGFCDASGNPITIDTETAVPLNILSGSSVSPSAAFPKGYQGFYIMKYETSQEEYVEYLNALPLAEQTALIPGVDALNVGDFVFGSQRNAPNCRNGVILSAKLAGKPLMFDSNLNNNNQYGESADGGTLAMNYTSISDAIGYASWAGLRPITEMEYEKACRRPYPQAPEAGEYAWNSASGANRATALNSGGSINETVNTGNVNAAAGLNGPVRCGAFATASAPGQAITGATYWGVMEMSGNLSELCANITNTTISKKTNGTGANTTTIFGTTPTQYGTRGGSFSDTYTTLTTSDRSAVSRFTTLLQRDSSVGFRCAYTYAAASAVDAGTIAESTKPCPGSTVTFSGTPATAGNVKITGYIWSVDDGSGFITIPGENGASLAYSNFFENKTYTFKRKAICSLGEKEIISKSYAIPNTATFTVSPLAATLGICSVTSVTASGANSYSWKYNGTELMTTAAYTPTKSHFGDLTTGNVTVVCDGIVGNCPVAKNITVVLNLTIIQTFKDCGDLLTDDCGNKYQTKLMEDGKCWMVDNLRFGYCNKTTFNQYSGSTVKDLIAPGYYGVCVASALVGAGNLYNWQAAMNHKDAVNNTLANPSGNVDGSSTSQWRGICPEGWHLPSGGSTGEFQLLYTALGSIVSNIYPGTGVDGWQGMLGGEDGGSLAGRFAYYWSSTIATYANVAYCFNFSKDNVNPQSLGMGKAGGGSIRCVKNY